MFKVNKKNTGTRYEMCRRLTMKIPEWRQFAISVFNSKHISHLVLVLLKYTLNKQMLVGVITGWQVCNFTKISAPLQLFFRFLARLMVVKLYNKSHKCLVINFLVFLCPPHMIPLPLNTPSFTVLLILQCFTHSNSIIWVPWPTDIWYGAHTSNIINNSMPLTRSYFTTRSL